MRTSILLFALLVMFSLPSSAQECGPQRHLSGERSSHFIQTQSIDSTGDPALEIRHGNLHFNRKNYAAAVVSYKRALELEPNYYSAHYNLGVANLDWGCYEAASEAFKRALALKQDSATYELLGVVHQRLKQPKAAVEYYKMALRLNPNSALSNNNLGFVYLDLSRDEEAAVFFRAALRLQPEFPEATQGLCVALRSLPPTLEALEKCTNAAQTAPDSEVYQYLLGYTYFSLDHFKEAIDSFNRANRINPRHGLTQNGLGHCYYRLGQHKEALEHFLLAIEFQPDLSDAYAGLGNVYYRMRKPKEATKALRQALKLDPNSVEAKYNLAIACLSMNQRDCALEQYNSLKFEEPEISRTLYRILFHNRVINARDRPTR